MKILYILFKRNFALNMLTCLCAALFFFLVLWIQINSNYTKIETEALRQFKDKNYYKISDTLVNQKEIDFFSNDNSFTILNRFSNALLTHFPLEYYNATWQPITVQNEFYLDMKFFAGQGYIKDNIQYKSIYSVQVNDNVLKFNNLQLQGEIFSSDDYYIKQGQNQLPIIVGNNFSEYYKIGDTIQLEHYWKPFEGVIIGILEPSQKIITYNFPELILDNYIILPATYFKELPEVKDIFLKASLLSRINGEIITDMKPLEIRSKLSEIASETSFVDFTLLGGNSIAINTLVKMTETNTKQVIIVSLIMFCLMFLLIIGIINLYTKKNIEVYKIMIISGADLVQLVKCNCVVISVSLVIGGCIPPLLILALTSHIALSLVLYYSVVAITSVILLTSFVFFYTKRKLIQLDLVRKLKE